MAQQQPEVGQKFWKEGVGSGKITCVLHYNDRLVIVDFFERGVEVFDYDDVLGNWTDDYGGSWMIYNI